MSSPKTIKSFLKMAIVLANAPTHGLPGSKKLTEKEVYDVAILSVVLQNELGQMDTILEKYNLKYL